MTDELLSNGVAAKLLSELLPSRTPGQWQLWLRNNRNMARRSAYRIPTEKLGGGAFYRREEITKFADFEKSKTLGTIKLTGRSAEVLRAFGFNEQGGSLTGRAFKVTGVTPQFDEGTRTDFIRIATEEPFNIYRIEKENARFLLRELTDIFANCSLFKEGNQGKQSSPDLSGYKTITDNPSIRILRKEVK